MSDPIPPLNLGTTGKSIALRLAEGIRTVISKGDDDGSACGARVPRPSGPRPPVLAACGLPE